MKINAITEEQMKVLIENQDKHRSKGNTNFRVLVDGCAVDIITGEVCKKGSNVIYQPVRWGFTKAGAEMIRKFIEVNNPGCKVAHTWAAE